MRKQVTWLALSVALHLVLVFSFRLPSRPPAPMVVELKPILPAASRSRWVARGPRHSGSVNGRGSMRLAPSFRPSVRGDIEVARPGAAPGPGWGGGGTSIDAIADLGRYDRLYELVDSRLVYPGVLSSHGVQGTVNARLVVDSRGVCDWHASHISSTQQHLQLYVIDVLHRVCEQPLARFARADGASNFDFSFTFAITEHNDASLIAAQQKLFGNVFLFYRNSQHSAAEWSIGPFHGLFPVPYVALDLGWLQENYDRVMHSRDPLNEFKEHLQRDQI